MSVSKRTAGLGVLCATCAAFGALVPSLLRAVALPHTFANNTVASAAEVNANFTTLAIAIDERMPIGTIVAWHRNAVTPALALPAGWAECNGTAVSVPTSGPLDPDGDGLYTPPDLNNTPSGYTGGGRFLRGSPTSGTLQGGTLHLGPSEIGVSNEVYFGNWTAGTGSTPVETDADFLDAQPGRAVISVSEVTNNTRLDGYRARPVNMSVVWLMRVR